jgi:hypothetical protein
MSDYGMEFSATGNASNNTSFSVHSFEKWTSFRYLGIPISLKTSSSQDWQKIIEKINMKFVQWGTQWINPTGRVILIKAVMSALPLYQCSAIGSKGIINRFP